jgi:long-chain acyl-CoA synthetase
MEATRIFDLLGHYEKTYGNVSDVLAVKREGKWEKFSLEDYRNMANNFSYGLMELGLKKGDKIATVSNNRPEWNFTDMGAAQLGVVHVPIYPTISTEEFEFVLEHSEAKILIVSNAILYVKLLPIVSKLPQFLGFYTFNPIEGAQNFKDIIQLGKENAHKHAEKLEEIKKTVQTNDLTSIIYTSGTTGIPKGVMLSHNNFLSNVDATYNILPAKSGDKAISFLPLCHVLERMVNYLYQYKGIRVYYAESIDSIVDNMQDIKPDIFVSVPRVLEKIYDRILLKGKSLTGIKRKLFHWAVELALKFELNNENGALYAKQLAIADKLIFSKWRDALGGNVKYVIVGGAALQPRLARTFWAANIHVYEGYGLTETSPVVAVNQDIYPYIKFGSVGPIIDKVSVKIAEDGEILVKGPNLMLGYYKSPEKTTEAVDEEGWFHTGDIGVILEHNILKITDRKKEIFKLSGGKYVAPQVIENKLKESFFIEQAMVVGEGEKFAATLISPNYEFLHDWCSKEKIHYRDNIDLLENPKVIERYLEEIEKVNKTLGKTESIKKFALVCEAWTTENGALSPTLKLKRKVLKKRYKVKLDRLFGYTDQDGNLLKRDENGHLIPTGLINED